MNSIYSWFFYGRSCMAWNMWWNQDGSCTLSLPEENQARLSLVILRHYSCFLSLLIVFISKNWSFEPIHEVRGIPTSTIVLVLTRKFVLMWLRIISYGLMGHSLLPPMILKIFVKEKSPRSKPGNNQVCIIWCHSRRKLSAVLVCGEHEFISATLGEHSPETKEVFARFKSMWETLFRAYTALNIKNTFLFVIKERRGEVLGKGSKRMDWFLMPTLLLCNTTWRMAGPFWYIN